MGKQLERKCEFAIALKCYNAGRAYYKKLSLSALSEASVPIFEALYDALSTVAETNPEWKLMHAGVLLPECLGGVVISKEIRVAHLRTLICSFCQRPDDNEEVFHLFCHVLSYLVSPLVFVLFNLLITPSDLLHGIEDM